MFRFFHRVNVYDWVGGIWVGLFFPTIEIHVFKIHLVSRDLMYHYRKINFL